jgi:hypothetical protein
LIQALAGDEPTYSDATPAFFIGLSVPKKVGAANVAWDSPGSLRAFDNDMRGGRQIHLQGNDADGHSIDLHSPQLGGNESVKDYCDWVASHYPASKKVDFYFLNDDPRDPTNSSVLYVIALALPPHHGDEDAERSDGTHQPWVITASSDFANPPKPQSDWSWRDPWEGLALRKLKEATTSGEAHRFRGAFIFYGKDVYDQGFNYTIGKNVVHELSHVLFCMHQNTSTSKNTDDQHDWADFCVMSYDASPLGKDSIAHCGRCLLQLRGWNIDKIPANPGAKNQRRAHGLGVD